MTMHDDIFFEFQDITEELDGYWKVTGNNYKAFTDHPADMEHSYSPIASDIAPAIEITDINTTKAKMILLKVAMMN